MPIPSPATAPVAAPDPSLPPRFSGAGPGVQARDGCSVELYRELPYLGELEDIRSRLPAGSRVLELGCGTGRLTRVLMDLGCTVLAVDNCTEMLAHLPPGATPVAADIETLALDERFDVAILASGLVNHPDADLRHAFLAAAYRHLRAGGRFFVQRHDAAWLRSAAVGTGNALSAVAMEVEALARAGDRVAMTLRYDAGGRTWRQSFVAEALDDAAIEEALAQAGFAGTMWHGARRRWTEALAGPPLA